MLILHAYALSFLGTPYHWGGNNILQGMDCSGLVGELLRSVGEVEINQDLGAQDIFNLYERDGEWNRTELGALAFYGESVNKITHVAMFLDAFRIIEAGGGGHLILTVDDAKAKGAVVRIRMANHRKDLVAVIKPRYSKIGQI